MRREARFPVAGIRGLSTGISQAAALAYVPQNLNFIVLPGAHAGLTWPGLLSLLPDFPGLFSLVAPWVEEED